MAISRTTQNALAKNDFAAIEDEWLARSAENPQDLDYFIGVARALSGHGQTDRARALLEMLDDQQRELGLWSVRLKLLERSGALLYDGDKLYKAALETLRALHRGHSGFEMLAEKIGLHRAPQNTQKLWEKVERMENILTFDVGSVVLMQGKGAGRIQEINVALESFKVDFSGHRGLMVGFRAAAKLLTVLEPSHVLYRKLEDPDSLKKLADDDPAALLRIVLESYAEPMTGAQIRSDLTGVVSESRWNTFWTTARKHPQVLVDGKGRQAYRWAASTGHASDALWQAFENGDPAARVDLFRRNAQRDEELRRRMSEVLLRQGEELAENDPAISFQIYYALEKSGLAPVDVAWAPERLLAAPADAVRILLAVPDRALRERGYELLRELREDWRALYLAILGRETEGRSLSLLAEALEADGASELERFIEQVLSQPRKLPAAFVWLAERAADDERLLERSPLRFLQQLLTSLQDEAFAPYRAARLVPLFESGGTAPRLLPFLQEEQAEPADISISRAAALGDYQRDALRNALQLRFPVLRGEPETPLYASRASIEAKRNELNHLKSVEIPTNRKAIQEAREMGDLRENFEYKSARQRHEYLNARLGSLARDLARVQPIEFENLDLATVRIGTRVELALGNGTRRTITILGPWESQPEMDVVSYESDLGKSLLGRAVGDQLEVAGGTATVQGITSAA